MGAQARLSSLRAQLAGIPKVIYIDGPGPIILSSSTGNTPVAGRGGSLFQRLAEAKQSLIDLKSKYTDDYPDVQAVKREIVQLQSELATAPQVGPQGSGNQSVPNPVYTQTQSKLSDAMTDVAFQAQRLGDAQDCLANSMKSSSKAIGNQRPVRQSGPRLRPCPQDLPGSSGAT